MNKDQIKLIQTAARAAGIRDGKQDGRYRFLLAQYKKSNGQICVSCKDLNNYQVDDFLAICESQGWRHTGKSETHYRDKVARSYDGSRASYAQQEAIRYLAGDLGFHPQAGNTFLAKFLMRMTRDQVDCIERLSSRQAYNVIEALKAALGRRDGVTYQSLNDIINHYKDKGVIHDREVEQETPI